ncbi:hypothetical protein XELAEV_18035913mg [Xenopus laevis]|uniref:Uncharacterized protein n=1 Tax=Xenopus laevis TaxID=8355 RepID=A0A974HCJ9_XENLA|nr:hypothetical protein XELAEV_18035913mg [Xenopus laevis]
MDGIHAVTAFQIQPNNHILITNSRDHREILTCSTGVKAHSRRVLPPAGCNMHYSQEFIEWLEIGILAVKLPLKYTHSMDNVICLLTLVVV